MGGIIVAKNTFSIKAFMFLESEELRSGSLEGKANVVRDSESFATLSDQEIHTKITWLLNEVEKIENYFGRFDEVVLVYEWDIGNFQSSLKKKKIKVKSTLEFISDFLFAKSGLNDKDAVKNKREWKKFIDNRFS